MPKDVNFPFFAETRFALFQGPPMISPQRFPGSNLREKADMSLIGKLRRTWLFSARDARQGSQSFPGARLFEGGSVGICVVACGSS